MATQAVPQQPLNPANISTALIWVMQIVGAFIFFNSGFNKLAGAQMAVEMFETIGIGQWFRYVTGAIEAGSALMLLIPRLAGVGALLLMGVMTGAIIAELFLLSGNPTLPITLMIMMFLIAHFRRDNTAGLINRSSEI